MEKLIQILKRFYYRISPVYRTVRRIEDKVDQLGVLPQRLDALANRQEAIFWWQMNQPGESMTETKRRVFRDMPQAEGTLRTIQLGSNYLLRQLKKICEENEITYWLFFGTLLGAARHGGFIPWDDDIDVSLLRNDFQKLQKALKQNEAFALRPYYEEDGQFYLYKMVFRENTELFWVDVTIWDQADTGPLGEEETWRRIAQVREKTMEELGRTARHFETRYHSQALSAADAAALQKVFEKNFLLLPTADTPNCIYRSLDSVYLGGETLVRPEDIFPLRELPFEGVSYPVPARYEHYLAQTYRDLDLPLQVAPGHLDFAAKAAEQVEACIRELGLEETLQRGNDRK